MNADQRLARPRFGQFDLGDLQDPGLPVSAKRMAGVRHRGSWLVDGDRRAGRTLVIMAGGAVAEHNIVLTGFMGSGKSSVGAALAAVLGRRFVETDAVIVERYGPIRRSSPSTARRPSGLASENWPTSSPMKRRWSSRPEAACSSTRQSPSGSNPADGCSASRHHPPRPSPGSGPMASSIGLLDTADPEAVSPNSWPSAPRPTRGSRRSRPTVNRRRDADDIVVRIRG